MRRELFARILTRRWDWADNYVPVGMADAATERTHSSFYLDIVYLCCVTQYPTQPNHTRSDTEARQSGCEIASGWPIYLVVYSCVEFYSSSSYSTSICRLGKWEKRYPHPIYQPLPFVLCSAGHLRRIVNIHLKRLVTSPSSVYFAFLSTPTHFR